MYTKAAVLVVFCLALHTLDWLFAAGSKRPYPTGSGVRIFGMWVVALIALIFTTTPSA